MKDNMFIKEDTWKRIHERVVHEREYMKENTWKGIHERKYIKE